MRLGSLFSGYGGLDMAAETFYGATTAWVSDIDKGACKILAHRYPDVPNIGDITQVDWAALEPVDILTGGFPCQDLSHAGKRAGMRPDTRSGLWTHMAYAVSILRPRYVVAENVRGLLSAAAHSSVEPCAWCVGGAGDGEPDLRALGAVLGDLADLGYDAQWVGLRAADIGAPHGRFRVFVVATDTRSEHRDERGITAPRQAEVGRALGQPARRSGTLAVTDTQSNGRDERRTESARQLGRPDAALGGAPVTPNAGSERHGRGQDGRGLGRLDSEDASGARERERAREVAGNRSAAATADAERQRLEERRRPGGLPKELAGPDDRLLSLPAGLAQPHEANGATLPLHVGGPVNNAHAANEGAQPLIGLQAVEAGPLGLVVADDSAVRSLLPGEGLGVVGVGAIPGDVGHGLTLGQSERTVNKAERTNSCGCSFWGLYAPAIHRWEIQLGRLAPAPTELGPKGAARLSPRAVEFMMGLPAGHVTDVPGLTRNEMLKALGNGVVPQQALAALHMMHGSSAVAA